MHSRTFNAREKLIIKNIITVAPAGPVLMNHLLEKFFFTEKNGRALIIQAQAQYAVFFLHNNLFDDEQVKKKELEEFLELITLISYLRYHGYISLYRDEKTKEKSMVFIQDNFNNPIPSKGSILLNPKGDYTIKPDTIHDKNNEVIYKGVVFDSDTYDMILSCTTGALLVSHSLKEITGKGTDVDDDRS